MNADRQPRGHRTAQSCAAVGLLLWSLGCRSDEGPRRNLPSQPVVDAAGERSPDRQDAEFDGVVQFANGARLRDVVVSPDVIAPSVPMEVRFAFEGPGGKLEISAHPPRDAGRQVAKGGVDAPPVDVPADPRRVTTVVDTAAGTANLVLPQPWHPKVTVVQARLLRDDTMIPATGGARTHDGRAVLAMVEVERTPTTLVAPRAASPIAVDGALDEPLWREHPPLPLTHSLDGEPVDEVQTDVWVAWSERALLVAGRIADRDIRSSYTTHDDPLWKQEVFEVFVFGGDERRNYLELQVSPRGVTFDARFEQYRKGDQAWDSQWETAVALDGTVDRGQDRDRGWTVEIAVPWTEICQHTEVTCPVQPGTTLRMNLFRFERPEGASPIGLSLSPTLQPDFHAPENSAVVELGS